MRADEGLKEAEMRGRCYELGCWAVMFCLLVGEAKAADFVSGNELWESCQDSNKLQFCYGYIVGAAQTNSISRPMKTKPFFCIAPAVQNQQLLDIVTSYLREHPEKRQWPGPTLII